MDTIVPDPPAPLTPLELASGIVSGSADHLGPAGSAAAPVDALDRAVERAVAGRHCFVSFSGGIDSALVLAAATRMARRWGRPLPVPLTWRFADAPAATESRWQERVVSELGLEDWVRRVAEPGELDLVGPVATGVLARHGILHPANAFLHAPLLAEARGGVLLTGVGGDQILGNWRWREASAVMRRERPLGPRALASVARSRSPLILRARLEPRAAVHSPWLRPRADRAVSAAHARDVAAEPRTWPARLLYQRTRRDLALGLGALDRLAADAGAAVAHPLVDLEFIAGLASAGGRWGAGSRAATVTALLGEILPQALSERRTKAHFDEVFWHAAARGLMREWDGDGVDQGVVDATALKALWRGAALHPRTAHLLQSVWLARHARHRDLPAP